MRTLTIEIKLYKFDELNEEMKKVAINNEINSMIEFHYMPNSPYGSDNLKRAIKKAVDMQTPWFAGEYIWEYCKDEVLDNLSRYEFTGDGKIYCLND
jgi:hypothetical protein